MKTIYVVTVSILFLAQVSFAKPICNAKCIAGTCIFGDGSCICKPGYFDPSGFTDVLTVCSLCDVNCIPKTCSFLGNGCVCKPGYDSPSGGLTNVCKPNKDKDEQKDKDKKNEKEDEVLLPKPTSCDVNCVPGTCTAEGDTVFCVCKPGYYDPQDGLVVHVCLPCDKNCIPGTCNNGYNDGTARGSCYCKHGYHGQSLPFPSSTTVCKPTRKRHKKPTHNHLSREQKKDAKEYEAYEKRHGDHDRTADSVSQSLEDARTREKQEVKVHVDPHPKSVSKNP